MEKGKKEMESEIGSPAGRRHRGREKKESGVE
jgi:hypothetical protein